MLRLHLSFNCTSEGSNGVIAKIDSLVADLEKEMQEVELQEMDSQGNYEQFTRHAADNFCDDAVAV